MNSHFESQTVSLLSSIAARREALDVQMRRQPRAWDLSMSGRRVHSAATGVQQTARARQATALQRGETFVATPTASTPVALRQLPERTTITVSNISLLPAVANMLQQSHEHLTPRKYSASRSWAIHRSSIGGRNVSQSRRSSSHRDATLAVDGSASLLANRTHLPGDSTQQKPADSQKLSNGLSATSLSEADGRGSDAMARRRKAPWQLRVSTATPTVFAMPMDVDQSPVAGTRSRRSSRSGGRVAGRNQQLHLDVSAAQRPVLAPDGAGAGVDVGTPGRLESASMTVPRDAPRSSRYGMSRTPRLLSSRSRPASGHHLRSPQHPSALPRIDDEPSSVRAQPQATFWGDARSLSGVSMPGGEGRLTRAFSPAHDNAAPDYGAHSPTRASRKLMSSPVHNGPIDTPPSPIKRSAGDSELVRGHAMLPRSAGLAPSPGKGATSSPISPNLNQAEAALNSYLPPIGRESITAADGGTDSQGVGDPGPSQPGPQEQTPLRFSTSSPEEKCEARSTASRADPDDMAQPLPAQPTSISVLCQPTVHPSHEEPRRLLSACTVVNGAIAYDPHLAASPALAHANEWLVIQDPAPGILRLTTGPKAPAAALRLARAGLQCLPRIDDHAAATVPLLDLQHNQFGTLQLPSSLCALQSVLASHNRLQQLPDISQLPSLRSLRLSHNPNILQSGSSMHSASLESLHLAHCCISQEEFDAFICNIRSLPNLARLDLSGNQIRHLRGLQHCEALHTISAAQNMIDHVEELPWMSLTTLDLRHNQLRSLQGLHGLWDRDGMSAAAIRWIDLRENPIDMADGMAEQLHGQFPDLDIQLPTGLQLARAALNTASPVLLQNDTPPLTPSEPQLPASHRESSSRSSPREALEQSFRWDAKAKPATLSIRGGGAAMLGLHDLVAQRKAQSLIMDTVGLQDLEKTVVALASFKRLNSIHISAYLGRELLPLLYIFSMIPARVQDFSIDAPELGPVDSRILGPIARMFMPHLDTVCVGGCVQSAPLSQHDLKMLTQLREAYLADERSGQSGPIQATTMIPGTATPRPTLDSSGKGGKPPSGTSKSSWSRSKKAYQKLLQLLTTERAIQPVVASAIQHMVPALLGDWAVEACGTIKL